MDNQEAFSKVCIHLATQARRATNSGGCAYHATNGDKCAIGCLIPDDKYYPTIEGKAIDLILSQSYTLASLFKGVSKDLLFDLQRMHDDIIISSWFDRLISLRAQYQLKIPAFDYTKIGGPDLTNGGAL